MLGGNWSHLSLIISQERKSLFWLNPELGRGEAKKSSKTENLTRQDHASADPTAAGPWEQVPH